MFKDSIGYDSLSPSGVEFEFEFEFMFVWGVMQHGDERGDGGICTGYLHVYVSSSRIRKQKRIERSAIKS